MIPFIYKDAKPFDGDHAIVNFSYFINRSGEQVSEEYAYIRAFDESDLAYFAIDSQFGTQEGFLNRSLDIAIDPVWDVADRQTFGDDYETLYGTSIQPEAELVRVHSKTKKVKLIGMINRKGELVVPMIWEQIDRFNGGASPAVSYTHLTLPTTPYV